MAGPTVTASVSDWKTECNKADAANLLDQAQAGIVAVDATRADVAYEWSNGRRFVDGPGKTAP